MRDKARYYRTEVRLEIINKLGGFSKHRLQRQERWPTKAIGEIKNFCFLQPNFLKTDKNEGRHDLETILKNFFAKTARRSMQPLKILLNSKFRPPQIDNITFFGLTEVMKEPNL